MVAVCVSRDPVRSQYASLREATQIVMSHFDDERVKARLKCSKSCVSFLSLIVSQRMLGSTRERDGCRFVAAVVALTGHLVGIHKEKSHFMLCRTVRSRLHEHNIWTPARFLAVEDWLATLCFAERHSAATLWIAAKPPRAATSCCSRSKVIKVQLATIDHGTNSAAVCSVAKSL